MLGKLAIAFAFCRVAQSTLVNLGTSSTTGKAILRSTNFDYIIVGGGTAGLTIARRLSNDPNRKVLVLEAGSSGVNKTIVTIPENSGSFVGTDIDWFYNTSPQSYAANQTMNLSSGKILGGDSAVNGLVWVRGLRAEYDAYEQLGSPGWNWDTFDAAMKKAEALNQPSQELVEEYGFVIEPSSVGSSGPLAVSFPDFLPIAHQHFIPASLELGHYFNRDAYSGNNTGVFYSLSSQTSVGVRETSEFAFADPVIARDNLVVFYNALVTKLNLTSPAHNGDIVSSGVQVRFPDNSVQFASVDPSNGEVILSAGVIRTPQLLELSGIGNKDILTPLGIDVKLDLAGVGENYEDQTVTTLNYELKEPHLSFDALHYNATLMAEQEELYKQGKGWLTFANCILNMQPITTVLTASELETAETILETKPPTISQELFESVKGRILNSGPQVEYILLNSFLAGTNKEANRSYVSIAIIHLHPLSRGSIHINTTSIDDHPVINPNVLEAKWDQWFLARATAYSRKFFQTPSFEEIFEKEVYPGDNVTTDTQWEQFVKNTVSLGHHSVGTASLLPREKNGVVDPQLKVYGTGNIRVADNSILPLLLSAHTQPAAYAIGEQAATIILGN